MIQAVFGTRRVGLTKHRMGMQTVWVFGNAEDIMKLPPTDVSGYLVYGGDVYGNASHAPQVVHFNEVDASRK